MNETLRLFLILCLLVFLMLVFRLMTRRRLSVKYTLVWLLMDIGMLIVALFPGLVDWFGGLVGITSPVNTTFLLAGMFVLTILLTLTIIVTQLNNHCCTLTQQIALLEKRVRELEGASADTGEGSGAD